MSRHVLTLTLTFLLFHSVSAWAKEKKTEDVVSVSRVLDSYTVSINANNVKLGKIIEELIEKCTIKVVVYGKDTLSRPISVSFEGLSIDEAIKRLIKVADIKNHLIRYEDNGKNRSEITAVTLFGNSGKEGKMTIINPPTEAEKEKESAPYIKGQSPPEDEFSEKIEYFIERYEWKEVEIMELAEHIIKNMPNPVKGQGLEKLVESLDKTINDGDKETIDEEIFYKAMEDSVPPKIAPIMMKSVKKYVQRYNSEEESEMSEESSNELY